MDPLFKFQRLNNNGHALAGSTAKSFDRLLARLRKKIKPCRETAIAEMHLEQACFFMKKAISVDPENHYVTKKQQKLQNLLPQRTRRNTEEKSQKPGARS